jgi:hypothetical protein
VDREDAGGRVESLVESVKRHQGGPLARPAEVAAALTTHWEGLDR